MKTIDLFAGAGGFTQGAKMAGIKVSWAGNHWPIAVDWHAANHPETAHSCQDLHQADWSCVPAHDLLLASPACTGHSHARGKDKPHHDTSRSTAWAVISCAEYHRPQTIIVENVLEFSDWELYGIWVMGLERLGYTYQRHILNSADHGVPQERFRLFMVFTRSESPLFLCLPKRDHVSARPYIDLTDSAPWNPIDAKLRVEFPRLKPLVPKTLDRIRQGRKQWGDVFLLPYYGSGSGLYARSIDRPIGTLGTVDTYGVVRGDQIRMLTVQENKLLMGFPPDYLLPECNRDAMKMIGNAVVPQVPCDLIQAIREAA